MKHTLPLQKKRAIELLGGSSAKVAIVLQYKSRAAVDKWPETLGYRDSLMVLGAIWLQEQAKDSPNNRLTAQRNVARTYQAIPDVYGSRRVWLDQAGAAGPETNDCTPAPRPARPVKRTRWLARRAA